MSEEQLINVVEFLNDLKSESALPKNIKFKIDNVIGSLSQTEIEIPVKVSKSLQELEEVVEDPNTPSEIRTQMWNVVSLLESI